MNIGGIIIAFCNVQDKFYAAKDLYMLKSQCALFDT